jgi:UDP-glucose 4-epimerase
MNEGIARSFRAMYGLAAVGLRYFNVYGPRMDATGAYTEVFIRWLECAADGRPPQIHGDGSATMDFIYVEDVAQANILALQSDRSDDVYNIAGGRETSLLELWRAVQQAAAASGVEPEFLPLRQVNPVPRRLADTRRAHDELGFKAEVPLEDGLGELVSWWRETTGCETTGKRREPPVT